MKSSVIFLLVCHSRGIAAEPETVLLRLSDEERHVVYVVICLIEEIIECEVVKEAFRTVHTVSVLIVVGGVVRVGNDYDVVLSCFGAQVSYPIITCQCPPQSFHPTIIGLPSASVCFIKSKVKTS